MFVWKGPKINEKEAGVGPFLKKYQLQVDALNWIGPKAMTRFCPIIVELRRSDATLATAAKPSTNAPSPSSTSFRTSTQRMIRFMELFGRRRWTTGPAQQSNTNYGIMPSMCWIIFLFNINTTAFCLGRSSLHLILLKSFM